MTNLVLHITLTKGFALTNGAVLQQPVTFDVVSRLNPYYASVDEVRLSGGPLLRKLSDLTIACAIYHASQESDMISPYHHIALNTHQGHRFAGARNHYTHDAAARNLLLSMGELAGRSGGHVLANFSVTRQPEKGDSGVSARLQDLKESMKLYEVTLRSGGRTMPGGHAMARMAAKGVMDWTEMTPGRTWFGNGMGTNATSMDIGSATGGRGKPVKYFASPMTSPSFNTMRNGLYQSGIQLTLGFPRL